MKFELRDGRSIDLPSNPKPAARYIADLIRNRGVNEDDGVEMNWADMVHYLSPRHTDEISSPDIRPLLESSMEVMLREPLEPLMTITGLFDRVEAKGLTTQVLAGAIGAVYAADVAEGGTYPEVMFQIGGGMQTAYIGKSGIAAAFTAEALRYSTWDIFAMNLRLMGAALLRHKEQKAVSFLRTLGTELFNNVSPSSSMFGVCTGRGLDGSGNGSLTLDDLFKAMAHMDEEGFSPDTILVNPLFFYQFVQDPNLRGMMMAHGGGSFFNPYTGVAGPRTPWPNGGGMGVSSGNRINASGNAAGEAATGIAGREHGMTAAFSMPGHFPWPMRVAVSPLVPFDAASQLGDVFLLSSGNVGFHLVDEEAVQVEWMDESRDISKVKLRERYGFAVKHEGQGVGVMKNVKLARNYWDGTLSAVTHDIDSEIGPTDSVL